MKQGIQVILLLFCISFYGQNDTISVEENDNVSQVFIKTNKVIYRGIRNQIFINVPNPETLTASSPGLIFEKGKFFIVPTSGTEQKIFLRFKKNNGDFTSEEHVLKIDTIDSVLGLINGNNCNNCIVLVKKEELQNFKVSIKIPNHPFIDELEAGGFKISFKSKNKWISLSNKSNTLSDENYKIVSELAIGSRFIISDIYNKVRCESCSEFISIIQVEIVE